MQRTFIFFVSKLLYDKNDLNVPFSRSRGIIGQLARMVTNSLFLSHSLRQGLTVRIFVSLPKPHIFHFKSETIRYLGPELRSLASILNKAENYFNEEILRNASLRHWMEPNPGLFVRLADDPFIDLDVSLQTTRLFYIKNKQVDFKIQTTKSNLLSLEYSITLNHHKKSIIFIFDLGQDQENYILPSLHAFENITSIINIEDVIALPNIVCIVNLILDKLEREK